MEYYNKYKSERKFFPKDVNLYNINKKPLLFKKLILLLTQITKKY